MKAITRLLPRKSARARFAGSALAVAAGSGLLLGGPATPGAGTASAAGRISTTRSVGAVVPPGVFSRVLDQPSVKVTGGRFYVSWQNQASRNVPSPTLVPAHH